MKKLFTCLFAILLAGCSATNDTRPLPAPSPSGADAVEDVLTGNFFTQNTSPPTTDLSRIKVPVLKAPAIESKFGKPTYRVMADGSYLATYRWGKQIP